MAIFTEAFINEFFGFGNKKKKEDNKSYRIVFFSLLYNH